MMTGSTPEPAPAKTPAETIQAADRDLAAVIAMMEAISSYVIAWGEASGNDADNNLSFSLQTLIGVTVQITEKSRESVRQLTRIPLGTVVPIREGGAE